MDSLSSNQIDKIGEILREHNSGTEYNQAVISLNTWRKNHGDVMDYIYDNACDLVKTLRIVNPIVTERLKRLATILDKLKRFDKMRLSRMRDIGGVRIVTEDMEDMYSVENKILEWNGLVGNEIDYIKNPRTSGYRGKHFVFKKDNMFIELQLRTQLQHVWATSVETMDTFLGTSMKSGKDPSYWTEFFRLVSKLFECSELENTQLNSVKITDDLVGLMDQYRIEPKLLGYASTNSLALVPAPSDYFAIILLDKDKNFSKVTYYPESDYNKATSDYEALEKDGANSVLVSVNKLREIRDAYPNYFLDLKTFVELIKQILKNNMVK